MSATVCAYIYIAIKCICKHITHAITNVKSFLCIPKTASFIRLCCVNESGEIRHQFEYLVSIHLTYSKYIYIYMHNWLEVPLSVKVCPIESHNRWTRFIPSKDDWLVRSYIIVLSVVYLFVNGCGLHLFFCKIYKATYSLFFLHLR